MGFSRRRSGRVLKLRCQSGDILQGNNYLLHLVEGRLTPDTDLFHDVPRTGIMSRYASQAGSESRP